MGSNNQNQMAEREGFEPSYGVTHNTLSKRAPSTTRPPLQAWESVSLKTDQLAQRYLTV